MPKMDLVSKAPPSKFAYPPKLEPPKEKDKSKVATATLSVTNKAHLHAKRVRNCDGGGKERGRRGGPLTKVTFHFFY
jgi:hypothetical protein